MFSQVLLALFSLTIASTQATSCVASERPAAYAPPFSAPLNKISYDDTKNLVVEGNIVINDGCSFTVDNFNFTTTDDSSIPDDCVWYGYLGDPNSFDGTSPSIVDGNIPEQKNTNPTYQLSQVVGRAVSFADFNVIRLFCVKAKRVVAQSTLTEASKVGSNNNASSTSSAAPSQTPFTSTVFLTAALLLTTSVFCFSL